MDAGFGKIGLIASLCFSLVACGGGSGGGGGHYSGQPPGTAEGLWKGTSSTGRDLEGLVLPDGQYWVVYTAVGNNAVIAGAVEGNGTSQNGRFTSTNGLDFNFEGLGILDVDIDANYVKQKTLNGTLKYSNDQFTFTTDFQSAYNLTPTLSAITGTYDGTAEVGFGEEFTRVVITPQGSLTGQSASGCLFAGTVTTGSGGNYYNVSVTFQGGICANGTQTVTGVGYFDAATSVLWSAALNSARTDGFLFYGPKV
ncbi:MAG TPA: hypothetical protein PLE54_11980 [Burkholderiaceae bacterium]|nr:hypothetical protein [Burkholderiaceae bacterium]